ncbi:hypothetical protein DGMP_15780 [Desulfomarina profundi]|uniref:Uncharacterized protein n=1 Tax=Desulfomarina profundi TaxID=2772557 RepID=A0A8D5FNJ0_9BACT|nr:hypothetical protein DGMP_15780 [Desulfomarina profundi]
MALWVPSPNHITWIPSNMPLYQQYIPEQRVDPVIDLSDKPTSAGVLPQLGFYLFDNNTCPTDFVSV